MPTTLALTNATGRQSASLARAASAVGFHISAHIANPSYSPLVAAELAALPRVTIHKGPLSSRTLQEQLFSGADYAFVNTTPFDDELAVGKSCADVAEAYGIRHVVYSSMPDHGDAGEAGWRGLPHYQPKFTVETYIRTLRIPATYVYTGVYHNNFTSLRYPLFCLREVSWKDVSHWGPQHLCEWQEETNGEKTKGRKCGFEWQAPFPANVKLPLLDCEHDFGPAVLQIFKEGPEKWRDRKVPLAFSILDPTEICAAFARGLGRPVRYVEGPIEVTVPIPLGYQSQLDAVQAVFGSVAVGGKGAPYWWDGLFEPPGETEEFPNLDDQDEEDDSKQSTGEEVLRVARTLWGGRRDVEGYARDIFPVEERLNGQTWME